MRSKFKIDYRGKMFEVISWEGKPGIRYEAVARSPGVRLIIETEKDGVKALLMLREFRQEVDGYDFRLPGGKIFDSLKELDEHRGSKEGIANAAQKAAEKEGLEEAGITQGEYTPLDISRAGATIDWDLHYFKVNNAKIGKQQLEETEQGDIETVILSAKEIFNKLINREIKEGRSADMIWSWLQKNGFLRFADKP